MIYSPTFMQKIKQFINMSKINFEKHNIEKKNDKFNNSNHIKNIKK